MYKTVTYGLAKHKGEVAYKILGNRVFFCAQTITPSSINSAEQIITSISAEERLDWTQCQFFDVQTSRGYMSKRPGKYEVDFLRMDVNGDGTPNVIGWIEAILSNEELEQLRELID